MDRYLLIKVLSTWRIVEYDPDLLPIKRMIFCEISECREEDARRICDLLNSEGSN